MIASEILVVNCRWENTAEGRDLPRKEIRRKEKFAVEEPMVFNVGYLFEVCGSKYRSFSG